MTRIIKANHGYVGGDALIGMEVEPVYFPHISHNYVCVTDPGDVQILKKLGAWSERDGDGREVVPFGDGEDFEYKE